jgi:hypothetical protein
MGDKRKPSGQKANAPLVGPASNWGIVFRMLLALPMGKKPQVLRTKRLATVGLIAQFRNYRSRQIRGPDAAYLAAENC